MIQLLLLAPLVAFRVWAAEPPQRRPRCPEGEDPVFAGHPFRPISCPRSDARGEAQRVILSTSPALPSLSRGKAKLADLAGRWEGLTYYGGSRYEALLEVTKAGWRRYRVRLQTRDYHLKTLYTLEGEVSDSIWKPGRYQGTARLTDLPDLPLKARAWVGAPAGAGKGGLEREAVLVYDGRKDSHRITFSVREKEGIRFVYTYLDSSGRPQQAFGDLKAASRPSL